MKFGVVVFPGSNCDDDTVYAFRDNLGQEAVKLWHKDRDLQDCEVIVLPGGFAHGDYLRAGAIARFSPIMDSVIEHAQKGGMVLGICNGFQVLCESHLLPGALVGNDNQKFVCKNIHVQPQSYNSLLTHNLEDRAYKVPIANAEGRYFAHQPDLQKLAEEDRILFKYCDEKGDKTDEANPNGSMDNIAAICNDHRNVIGIMPHPERAADEVLGNTDGKLILSSIIEAVGV